MCFSQNQFSNEIGISQGTLAKIEMNMLKIDKYQDKIQAVFDKWRTEKIKALEEEIDFLKNVK